jgi:BolA-like protein 3
MYQIEVVSKAFEGKGILQQHKMVKEVLKEDIPKWHGLTLTTKTA